MRQFLILLILSTAMFGQSPDSLFNLGNRYYGAEQFTQAANFYERLSKQVEHEDLYLNLGNAYFRMGELGHAVWAYEKGYALSPRDRDLNYNLNFIRSQVRDRIQPPEDFFVVAFYRAIIEKLTILDLLIMGGFSFAGLGIFYFLRANGHIFEKTGTVFNAILLLSVLVTVWTMLDKYWDVSDKQEGVVISSAVDVRSAPIARGENVVFRIHEGTKVDIATTQPGWFEVILLDGKKGWIPSDEVWTL
jgi:tetratricopeptide (TPR) repeat protein